MLRLSFRPLRKASSVVQTRLFNRKHGAYRVPPNAVPPLRLIGPTVWCFFTASTIVLGCAGWEVYQDVREVKRKRLRPTAVNSPITYNQLEAVRTLSQSWNHQSKSMLEQIASGTWGSLLETDKMIAGTIGLNTAIFAMSRILPGLQWHFSHLPAGPFNYTLLTSIFGHAGILHLGANMYGLYNFAPQVARSQTFGHSGAHLTAFYLSAGVFSSLASHLTSKWASPRAVRSAFLVPGLGASGAIFGILGAWAMMFPNAQVGLLFLPGSLPADQALVGIAAFEAYGLAVGFKSLNFGHAAHLAGLAIGSGYVYFNGNRRIWQPSRMFMFKLLRLSGLI